MQFIDTSNVSSGQAMPYTSSMVEWLQLNEYRSLRNLVAGLRGFTSNYTTPMAWYGCVKTGGPSFNISGGAIVYAIPADGTGAIKGIDLIECNPATGIVLTGSQVIVGTITTTYPLVGTSDPVIFSNGVSFNVHARKVVNWSAGTSGSGDFEYSQMTFLNEDWQAPSYGTGWSDDSFNGNGGLRFKRNLIGRSLEFKGSTQSSNNGGSGNPIMTLPSGYRPLVNKCLPVVCQIDSSVTLVTGLLVIDASTGAVKLITSASSTIDIVTLDNVVIPLD